MKKNNKKDAVTVRNRLIRKTSLTIALMTGALSPVYAGQSFLVLEPGFTQEVFGVDNNFFGGVAFAPDGDPWVNNCFFSGSPMLRFDAQTLLPTVYGTATLHAVSSVDSNAGCGMANHPDGFIYSNTNGGISQINALTGVATGVIFGMPGNALSIIIDPITQNVVHVGTDGTLYTTPVNGSSSVFSNAAVGKRIDGINFDPSGQFLFLANRTSLTVTILKRDGTLVQDVPLPSEPDGIAFHVALPKFVVVNNNDGTISKLTFPSDDFTKSPAVSLFASGGFRGDLSQVGADGCLYLTQGGVRYDDGTTAFDNSLVKICSGFAPQQPKPAVSKDPCIGDPPAGAIVGKIGNDLITGTPGNDVIFGMAGNDNIDGLGGNDLICGGLGADLLKGGDGNDTIKGGDGDDIIKGDLGNDKIDGGKGDDYAQGGLGKDNLFGGPGNDKLMSIDYVDGNDIVNGGSNTSGDICTGDIRDTITNCEPKSCDFEDENHHKWYKWHHKWFSWHSSRTGAGSEHDHEDDDDDEDESCEVEAEDHHHHHDSHHEESHHDRRAFRR